MMILAGIMSKKGCLISEEYGTRLINTYSRLFDIVRADNTFNLTIFQIPMQVYDELY